MDVSCSRFSLAFCRYILIDFSHNLTFIPSFLHLPSFFPSFPSFLSLFLTADAAAAADHGSRPQSAGLTPATPPIVTPGPTGSAALQGPFLSVPILIECDRGSEIEVTASDVLSGHEVVRCFTVPPRVPFVFEIGPLLTETRYNVTFSSGLKKSNFNTFVLNTHLNWSESNVFVVNCQPIANGPPSSTFFMDIVKRSRVPFNGITCIVHTRFQPSCDKVCVCCDVLCCAVLLYSTLCFVVLFCYVLLCFMLLFYC
jgi:hypothetical protein